MNQNIPVCVSVRLPNGSFVRKVKELSKEYLEKYENRDDFGFENFKRFFTFHAHLTQARIFKALTNRIQPKLVGMALLILIIYSSKNSDSFHIIDIFFRSICALSTR